jgi:hypothetical protein
MQEERSIIVRRKQAYLKAFIGDLFRKIETSITKLSNSPCNFFNMNFRG